MSNEYKDWQTDEIHDLRQQLATVTKERDELTEYIAKHNELVQKLTIELAEYQVKEHKVGIRRCR